jgi:hypothetical protein
MSARLAAVALQTSPINKYAPKEKQVGRLSVSCSINSRCDVCFLAYQNSPCWLLPSSCDESLALTANEQQIVSQPASPVPGRVLRVKSSIKIEFCKAVPYNFFCSCLILKRKTDELSSVFTLKERAMALYLLDISLKVEVFFDWEDCTYDDNICIQFIEDCPDDEKILLAGETDIYLTLAEARLFAQALLKAADESEAACNPPADQPA